MLDLSNNRKRAHITLIPRKVKILRTDLSYTKQQIASVTHFHEFIIWENILLYQRAKLHDIYHAQIPKLKNKKPRQLSDGEIFVQKTNHILELQLDNSEFDVSTFSREMGLSRVHLYRKMKLHTNQSPSEYIRNYRLKHAAKLLDLSNDSVTEIAYKVGFNDLSHFSKSFKQIFGVSPSKFKALEILGYSPF